MKNSKGWIIAGVVILLLLIGVWIWAASTKSTPVVLPPPPGGPPTPTPTSGLGVLVDFLKGLFGKKKEAYVQVEPIDENGCDANGYNKIGVRCFIF